MEAQGDPGSPDLDFDPEIQAACLQALLGLPIEINQRKIVSSPSEAFAPAAEKVAGGRTDPSPIKFSKFTISFFTAAYIARAPSSLGYFSSHFSEVFITLK